MRELQKGVLTGAEAFASTTCYNTTLTLDRNTKRVYLSFTRTKSADEYDKIRPGTCGSSLPRTEVLMNCTSWPKNSPARPYTTTLLRFSVAPATSSRTETVLGGTARQISRGVAGARQAVPQVHPNNPTLRNPKFAKEVFDNARRPRAWLIVSRRLRHSAEAILDRETPIAERFSARLRQITDGEEVDQANFPFPNFDAAHMLLGFAIENLLKGLDGRERYCKILGAEAS